MKPIASILLFVGTLANGQVNMQILQDSAITKYHIGASTYFEPFKEKAGYGYMAIVTKDGGGAAFGDGDEGTMLLKLSSTGKQQWKKFIKAKGTETEPQAVAEDKAGNLYVYQLVYDRAKYRGGCERVICFNKSGVQLWDKYLGQFAQLNNPTVSYIRTADDGRIYMRGHIVKTAPPKGQDPKYLYWEGWLNSAGTLTQKTGDVIDWSKPEWQKIFKPE